MLGAQDGDARPPSEAGGRRRLLGVGEVGLVALSAVLIGVFIVGYLRLGFDLWTGVRGPLVVAGLVVLPVLLSLARVSSRANRPRHYDVLEAIALLIAAVGAGVTASALGVFEGSQLSWGPALVAASLSSRRCWVARRG